MPKHSDGQLPPAVVMKLDVEGREVKPSPYKYQRTLTAFFYDLGQKKHFPKKVDIVPDLVMSGALAHIDNLMVDWTADLKDQMQWRPQVFRYILCMYIVQVDIEPGF